MAEFCETGFTTSVLAQMVRSSSSDATAREARRTSYRSVFAGKSGMLSRAVANCLSPSPHHRSPVAVASDALRVHICSDWGSTVHNENTGEPNFLVMDAKSPNLDTVAAVKFPRRVPYGFHGLFVTETDLNKL